MSTIQTTRGGVKPPGKTKAGTRVPATPLNRSAASNGSPCQRSDVCRSDLSCGGLTTGMAVRASELPIVLSRSRGRGGTCGDRLFFSQICSPEVAHRLRWPLPRTTGVLFGQPPRCSFWISASPAACSRFRDRLQWRHVRPQQWRIAGRGQRDRHPVHLEWPHLADRIHVVVAEDRQTASRRVAKPRRQPRVDESERVRDIPEAQHQAVGSHRPLPLVQNPVAHCPRVRLRPPAQPLRGVVPQVQVRPDPDALGGFVHDLDTPTASQQLPRRAIRRPSPHAARRRARSSCAGSLRTGFSVPPGSSSTVPE